LEKDENGIIDCAMGLNGSCC